jgi:hypothetical protein
LKYPAQEFSIANSAVTPSDASSDTLRGRESANSLKGIHVTRIDSNTIEAKVLIARFLSILNYLINNYIF